MKIGIKINNDVKSKIESSNQYQLNTSDSIAESSPINIEEAKATLEKYERILKTQTNQSIIDELQNEIKLLRETIRNVQFQSKKAEADIKWFYSARFKEKFYWDMTNGVHFESGAQYSEDEIYGLKDSSDWMMQMIHNTKKNCKAELIPKEYLVGQFAEELF